MLRNYLYVAARNLWRHKIYTAINIAGLSVGMACCILIVLFVRDEMGYDRHRERWEETTFAGHEDERWRMQVLRVDEDFLTLFGIELLAGRNFSAEVESDRCES